MPRDDKVFHNIIQLVLDKYAFIEKDHFSLFHDGTIGGKSLRRNLTLNYLEENKQDILKVKNKRVLNLGNLPFNGTISWSDNSVQDFFSRLLVYCIIVISLRLKMILKTTTHSSQSTAIATAAKPVRSPGTTKPPIRPAVVAKCIKRSV
jgi:hypothetical protein